MLLRLWNLDYFPNCTYMYLVIKLNNNYVWILYFELWHSLDQSAAAAGRGQTTWECWWGRRHGSRPGMRCNTPPPRMDAFYMYLREYEWAWFSRHKLPQPSPDSLGKVWTFSRSLGRSVGCRFSVSLPPTWQWRYGVQFRGQGLR